MIGRLVHLCDRASSVASSMPAAERNDAHRLLELCQSYAERSVDAEGEQGTNERTKVDQEFTRELSRLVEYLARRHAHGIPLATLGRAILAHQSGHHTFYAAACTETEQKLGLLGF